MSLMKAALLVLMLGVGFMIFTVMPGSENTTQAKASDPAPAQFSRADDPTYAEEVSALSALVRKGNEQAQVAKQGFETKLVKMESRMKDMERQDALAPEAAAQISELEGKLKNLFNEDIRSALDPLKSQISRLSSSRQRSSSANANGTSASALPGYVKVRPFGQTSAYNADSAMKLAAEKAEKAKAKPKSGLIPVYTLHDASMLSDSVSVTPIIGRVPNGGAVTDPFRFRLVTGGANLMANGHRVPGVKNAFWSGYAVGVREESCVRGYLDTVTFVFEDGRIVTQTSGKGSNISSSAINSSLGYLADPSGTQCITGTLISNASKYLQDRTGAAFLEGLASAYAQTQTTISRDSNGNLSSFVDGNIYQFGIGKGISKSAEEVAAYARQRQANAFDVVYLPSDQTVQIMLEQAINIDYDPSGRKVAYFQQSGDQDASNSTPLD